MYCGSCLQDNAVAAALTQAGVDIQLVPTYTPIRTDEADHSQKRVFFGGINVYLQEKAPVWRWLPTGLTGWLDNPRSSVGSPVEAWKLTRQCWAT